MMKEALAPIFLLCITLTAQELPDLRDVTDVPDVPYLPALPRLRNIPDILNVPDLFDLPYFPHGSVPRGEMIKETYHFDVEGVNRMDISISYGLGELIIGDNPNSNAIDGTIKYYPNRMTPDVHYHSFGTKGKLKIKVESNKDWEDDNGISLHLRDWKGLRNHEFDSELDFQLPRAIPMDMELDFGLGQASIDLSYLSFSDFSLECGLSDVKIIMNTPNPTRTRSVSIETGLGDLNAKGLGNLRAEEFNLDVGLGSADIDLTGSITEDLEGEINVGLGSLDLRLPGDANIKLKIEDSFLSSVNVDDLVKKGDVWSSPKWDDDLPTIELEISVGLGSVDVSFRK